MHTPQNANPIPPLPALGANQKRSASASGSDGRSSKILARTIFRDMKEYGIPPERILEVASELIGLVTAEMREDDETPPQES